jgi:predicted short-subunit dehydrogenase-like oxidoreductase (DUF2520 family)
LSKAATRFRGWTLLHTDLPSITEQLDPSGIAARELERLMNQRTNAPNALTIVGPGRVGSSIARAAEGAGIDVLLGGRDLSADQLTGRMVLLCVPDSAITAAAEHIAVVTSGGAPPLLLGHTSGATTLSQLDGRAGGTFSIHPLQTVPDGETDLRGCPAAIAGGDGSALAAARDLTAALGMVPFEIDEEDRATYHAAASIASNFLITLEQTAADLLGGIGVDAPRETLAPLVRRSLENWERRGPDALTGPIVRGDTETVERHRRALAEHSPETLEMYDAMADRTRAMVTR